MGVKLRLAAHCDQCGKVVEYWGSVHHDGDPAWDSMNGTADLAASDIEHRPELPDRWVYLTQYGQTEVQCDGCEKAKSKC